MENSVKSVMKSRREDSANYRALWLGGKTLRFAIDPSRLITELQYPEFYDIKITGNCLGKCQYCYQDSKPEEHYENIIEKICTFFESVPTDKLPFQVAIGGGEPTSHPDFIQLLMVLKNKYDICPNYTTNGMWTSDKALWEPLLWNTQKYCGGVAVSCHPHLKEFWEKAAELYSCYNISLNFHIIISDKDSVDYFKEIYDRWESKVDYFVLLPYGAQGRAKQKSIEWDYLVEKLPANQSKIAFGANFYPYLMKGNHNINISLYEPEIMSKFISMEGNGKLYNSSFCSEPIKKNIFV